MLCDGSEVSRTTYQQLFNTIGTSYGQGDGFTTFNLPDLRGKDIIGKLMSDTDFNALGKTGGEKTHALTVAEMPRHQHNVGNYNAGGDTVSYTDYMSQSGGANKGFSTNIKTDYAGNGNAHNNLQPYTVANYIIKAFQSSGVVATVVDNLNSNSSTDALSAKQGKILNEKLNDTGWESLTLLNSWSNYGSGFNNAQYRKIGKQVFLRGLIRNGTQGSVIAQLSSEYRPSKTNVFAVNSANESNVIGQIRIDSNGNIYAQTVVTWLSLDGVSFFID